MCRNFIPPEPLPWSRLRSFFSFPLPLGDGEEEGDHEWLDPIQLLQVHYGHVLNLVAAGLG